MSDIFRHPVNIFLPVDTFTWPEIEFPEIDFTITWPDESELDELLKQLQNEIDGTSCPWLEFSPEPLELGFPGCTTFNELD